MKNLKYRHASLNDLEAIVAIYNSVIPSRMVTADTELVTVDSKISWFNKHDIATRPLWIAEDEEGTIIGWMSFQDFYGRPAYSETAEISIYLDVNHTGKGLGKSMLRHCVSQCPALGIKTLLAFIFEHNERSIKLFSRSGFKEWASLPGIAKLDNAEYTLKILGKRISNIAT